MSDKMAGKEEIRYMLEETGVSVKRLSELLGIDYQVLRNKIYRNKFSFEEIKHYADVLGFDLKLIQK